MKFIELAASFTMVSEEDEARVSKCSWRMREDGQIVRFYDRPKLLPNFILKLPDSVKIIHLDGRKYNNNRTNLKVISND